MHSELRPVVVNMSETTTGPAVAARDYSREAVLSVPATVRLLGVHFSCRHSQRLPSLAVLAAFRSVSDVFTATVIPDRQIGAIGDIEITLANDDRVRTVYEMKQKVVTHDDLDRAVQKLAGREHRTDNYVVITTDRIDADVSNYAATLYEATGGTEFVVLDCLGFVRHFLHLFHRRRAAFLDAYQSLVLDQPDSAVGLPPKEAFLALRAAAVAAGE